MMKHQFSLSTVLSAAGALTAEPTRARTDTSHQSLHELRTRSYASIVAHHSTLHAATYLSLTSHVLIRQTSY